jgi:hypothetical protein
VIFASNPSNRFSTRHFLPPPNKMPLSQENRIQMAIAAYKINKFRSKLRAAAVSGKISSDWVCRPLGCPTRLGITLVLNRVLSHN